MERVRRMLFHEKIRLLRRARGFTQEQFAEKCEVSRQSVAKWESGAVLPEPEKLPRISDILQISLDVLLRDEMEPDAVREEHFCGALHASNKAGRYTGILIKESLADENILDEMQINKVELWRTESVPRYWTALYFTSDLYAFEHALSRALLSAKDGKSLWFCDFRAENTKFIVFHEKVLSYRIGDAEGRAQVVTECEKLGIPANQTHWED